MSYRLKISVTCGKFNTSTIEKIMALIMNETIEISDLKIGYTEIDKKENSQYSLFTDVNGIPNNSIESVNLADDFEFKEYTNDTDNVKEEEKGLNIVFQ